MRHGLYHMLCANPVGLRISVDRNLFLIVTRIHSVTAMISS
jgi:hypothetical protein